MERTKSKVLILDHARSGAGGRILTICSWLLLATVFGTLLAQTPTGTILGTVRDSSGAVIPGATVVVTNSLTGVRNTAATDEAGNYVVPYLIPGEYKVSAELRGFKTFQRSGILLQIDQKLRIDVDMQVGEPTETVTVAAGTPLLSTETSALGQVISSQQVLDLPRNTLFGTPQFGLITAARAARVIQFALKFYFREECSL